MFSWAIHTSDKIDFLLGVVPYKTCRLEKNTLKRKNVQSQLSVGFSVQNTTQNVMNLSIYAFRCAHFRKPFDRMKKSENNKEFRNWSKFKSMEKIEDHIFSNFSCFSIPIFFSNLNYNFSNLLDMRNLQELVKKTLCYQTLF